MHIIIICIILHSLIISSMPIFANSIDLVCVWMGGREMCNQIGESTQQSVGTISLKEPDES